MNYQVGQLIVGKVYNVKPYALFMSFEGGATGLLHISEISDSFVRDIEKYGSIGDEIKVKVLSIDPQNGFLRVSYKAIPEEERYNTHDESVHHFTQFDEADFHDLEAKLPEWISETLQKAKEEEKDD